ncbi:acyl carrier protein [Kitasatospora sp. LaBMicrA B282]|uniref:acyl carrier protein n=1 Tax=Kitasatospora sp. LaBMicrA B282 TaxID=3420949 RepID=UPI003D0EBCB3
MGTRNTGFEDLVYDLISVQYHGLKTGHDLRRFVEDAEAAGEEEIAAFFRAMMRQDGIRARRCQDFLNRLTARANGSPSAGPLVAGPLSRERSGTTG